MDSGGWLVKNIGKPTNHSYTQGLSAKYWYNDTHTYQCYYIYLHSH